MGLCDFHVAENMAAAQHLAHLREGVSAVSWEPSWYELDWMATILSRLGITTIAKVHGYFEEFVGNNLCIERFAVLGYHERLWAANVDQRAEDVPYLVADEHTGVGHVPFARNLGNGIDAANWAVTAASGAAILRGPARVGPQLSGKLGSRNADQSRVLLQRFVVDRAGHSEVVIRTSRATDAAYNKEFLGVKKRLGSLLDTDITYSQFEEAAGDLVQDAATRIPRLDVDAGDWGQLRGADIWARTPVDPKHQRLLERGLGQAIKGPTSVYRVDPNNSLWFHAPPTAQSKQAISEAFDKLRKEMHPARLLDWAARFYYRGATTMPYNRGSAGTVDVMMRALLEKRGIEVGRWRKYLAADRRAMIKSEAEFVKEFPHYFAIENPAFPPPPPLP